MNLEITEGNNRTRITLLATSMGDDLIVQIYNSSAHIGAVALGEYDIQHARASVSVVTRLGHKDDTLAQQAAHSISKSTRKPVCVIAGVHLDHITPDEIKKISENATSAVEKLLFKLL